MLGIIGISWFFLGLLVLGDAVITPGTQLTQSILGGLISVLGLIRIDEASR